MSETLIKVEDVSKKFCRDLKQSLWYGLQDMGSALWGRSHDHGARLRDGEFWAVENVSFELKRGECLGLIGRNGAGKTTLLRMLNGLITPDRGRIAMHGRVGAMIALGAGFNPILTGRENIYVNAALHGLKKSEVEARFDEIVAFSELGEFIETPVQNYSSGMQVRLGFSIASILEPDILLLDEVLAVGDIGFRAKCFNAIHRLLEQTAVIFVSHSMPQVSRTCTHAVVMERGRIAFQGNDVAAGIEAYYAQFPETDSQIAGSGLAQIRHVELEDEDGRRGVKRILHGSRLKIHIYLKIERQVAHPNIVVTFFNKESQVIAQCNSFFDGFAFQNTGDGLHCTIEVGQVDFNPGDYTLGITVTGDKLGEVLLKHLNILGFQVAGQFHGFAPLIISSQWSVDMQPVKEDIVDNE
jgi:lipopolysaccharide transport system ATP-binding protein